MAFKYAERVQETSTSISTGDIALAGAPDTSYQVFSAVFANGDTTDVAIFSATQFECCRATYNTGANSITRGARYASSNGGAAVDFGAGTKTIIVSAPGTLLSWLGNGAADTTKFLNGNLVFSTPPVGMSAVERQNFSLNMIYQAKSFVGYRRLIDMFADGYKASDGVASITGGAVDTTNGRVTNFAALSTGGLTKLGDMTTQGGLAAAFDGNTSQTRSASAEKVTSTAGYNNTVGVDWGIGVTNVITGFDLYAPTDGALLVATGSTVKLQGSSNNTDWNDLYTSGTVLSTNGSSVSVQSGITATAYRYHRININGNGTNSCSLAEVTFYGVSNATIVTTAQTVSAARTRARGLVEYNPLDSITLNTDLTVELSCNGGTNWTATTLTAAGIGQAGRLVAETDAVTCTSGTSIQARLKSFNNKSIQLYGLSWSVAA